VASVCRQRRRHGELTPGTASWGARIRVGINTGHCTVGVFGSDIMRAYKAVGFAVNVAARLQSEADPGTVLVGFRTYALVKDRVEAQPREPLNLKGAARPVEAWEIVALADR
jgi:adenylate cyclase